MSGGGGAAGFWPEQLFRSRRHFHARENFLHRQLKAGQQFRSGQHVTHTVFACGLASQDFARAANDQPDNLHTCLEMLFDLFHYLVEAINRGEDFNRQIRRHGQVAPPALGKAIISDKGNVRRSEISFAFRMKAIIDIAGKQANGITLEIVANLIRNVFVDDAMLEVRYFANNPPIIKLGRIGQ